MENLSQSKLNMPIMATRPTLLLFSVLVGLGVATVIALAWYQLDARERALIHRVTESTGRGIEALIRKDIAGRVTRLSGLAQRWGQPRGLPRAEWEASISNIFKTQPGFAAIGRIDSSLQTRWLLQHDGSKSLLQDNDFSLKPTTLAAAQLAQEQDSVIFTNPLQSVFGQQSIEILVPVYRTDAAGRKFDGLIISALMIDNLLENVLPTLLTTEHKITLSIDGKTVFSTDLNRPLSDREWQHQREFQLHDLHWQLTVVPKADSLLNAYYRFSHAMLALLILLSCLAVVTNYFVLTSRWRARQVQNAASRLEMLFRNLPGMSYRCDKDSPWQMEFVSDGCLALCGYGRKQFETQRVLWSELIHPDDRSRVAQSVSEAVSAGRQFNFEYRIKTAADAERWVWERGAPITVGDGHKMMLEGFITDITDRKKAEMALIQEKGYSEAIVDTAVEAVITFNAEAMIQTFNSAARKMYGYSFREISGHHLSCLVPDSHRAALDRYLAYYFTGQRSVEEHDHRDFRGRHKDGSEFPISVSMGEVPNQPRRTFVALIRDISRQIAAENEAREQREHLAHVGRLSMLGEMATGIAHEINQPLSAISLFSQAGKRLYEAGNASKLPGIFDKLSQHAQRAGAIIERMQNMARQQASSRETVECNALIREVVALAEADARIRDITIELELSDGLSPVSVDPVQIQQVVLNLLRNGMEAMQLVDCRWGDAIKLRSRMVEEGIIEIAVIDSGCGVTNAAAKHIFTPFSTTKATGMGMGLSISQAIVVAHGGQLKFFNNMAGGATFHFTLPTATSGEQHD